MILSRSAIRRPAAAALGALVMILPLASVARADPDSSPYSFMIEAAGRAAGSAVETASTVQRRHGWRHPRRHPPAARQNVLTEAARWLGRGNPTGTRGPWCADFVMFVLRRTGHVSIASRMARDAVAAGRPIAAPAVGAIMSTARHTGFVLRVLSARAVELLSGNHGHRVGIGLYSTRGARFALPREARR